MNRSTRHAPVVMGAQGLQAMIERRHSLAGCVEAHADALLASGAIRVLGIDLDPRLPVPPDLTTGDRPVLSATEFAPAPSDELPLRDLVPRWALAPDVALVVTVFGEPRHGSKNIALLQRADALLTLGDATAFRLVRALGVGKRRLHSLGDPGPDAIGASLTAYDSALGVRAQRVACRTSRRRRVTAPSGTRPRGSRLAVITPLPPARSGVAFYSVRLIEALARHIPVDVYREDDRYENPFDADVVRCMPARGFEWRWELARPRLPPLYCIGNNRYHVRAWCALMRQRGDVLLHDVQLSGLYQMLVHAGMLTTRELHERIRLIEGETPEGIDDPKLLMVGEVVDRARRVYVHSEAGRQMVLRKRPLRGRDVFVVPFAMPARTGDRQSAELPVVAAFGYMQCGRLLLDSAKQILARHPSVRVRVIGDGVRPGELEELRALARARELDDRLEFLGWSDAEQYDRELAQATVALQLRGYAHGEMSASVADCMAAGLPTVVNDFGALAELPDDAVVRVPRRTTPMDVAAAVIALLDDSPRRAALSASALRYARAHGVDRAASELLHLIADPRHADG